MNNETIHRSSDQLQAFVDGSLDTLERSDVSSHIEHCSECLRRVAEIRRLDRITRELPLEPAPEGFTLRVLAQLGLVSKPSLLVRAVAFLPYLFGLLVVLSLIAIAFLGFGVLRSDTTSTSGGPYEKAITEVQRYLSVASALVTDISGRLLPFFHEQGSITVWIVISVALIALLAIDRLVGRRVLPR
jgi:anti-sigma factor RsiW